MESRSSLRAERRGVSTFLQTFILIAIALGASLLVVRTISNYTTLASGPSISISGASIGQGSGAAVERLTVSNTGSVVVTSFTLLNPSIQGSVSYCTSTWDPKARALTSTTCPATRTNPGSIQFSQGLAPGGSTVIEVILIGGGVFTLGQAYTITVSAAPAALDAISVVAVPA
jgi:hypothetical protein